jgi:hypothetical protein
MKKIEKKLSFDKKTITELKNDELKSFYGGAKGSRNCPVEPLTTGSKDCGVTMSPGCPGPGDNSQQCITMAC